MLTGRKWLCSLALGLALILSSGAQSQQEPQLQNKPNNSQQPAPADQRGTENSPVVIKVLPPPNDPEKAKREAEKETDKSNADWWIVKLTGVLAAIGFFQLLVFGYQAKLLRETVTATREIGESALAFELPVVRSSKIGPEILSVDDLPAAHGPYAGSVNDGLITTNSVISGVGFKNFGRTPAFPLAISLGYCVGELPTTPKYSETVRCAADTAIEPLNDTEIETHFGFALTIKQLYSVRNFSETLWFYVSLAYEDASGRRHEARSCWQWGKENPEADGLFYFFDAGNAPPIYTVRT